MWFTPAVVRSMTMKDVVGGWSRMLRDYLVFQLTSPESGLETTGVALDLGGGQQTMIFAKLHMLLSDGDGLRLALEWMGANCTKPCWRHLNVLRKGSQLAAADGEYVEITCCDPAKFRPWGEQDFREAIDLILEAQARRAGGRMTVAALENIERTFGFRPTADGLLASATLRSRVAFQDVVRYDWVHTFLQDGILTGEAWLLIRAAESIGVSSQADVSVFLQEGWTVPLSRRKRGRCLWRIFDRYGSEANMKSDKLKCSASELLSLYILLRHFAETRLAGDARLSGKLQSFYLACKAVDTILCAKRGDTPLDQAGQLLKCCLRDYLAAHIREYGEEHVKPKAHWGFDVSDQLMQDTWVFDAFVIERLHLRVKCIAENVHNLTSFEASVLSGLLNSHSTRARDLAPGCGLLGRTAPLPGEPDILLSDHLEVGDRTFSVGDFVIRAGDIGRAAACCTDGIDLFLLVDVWHKERNISPHSSLWEHRGPDRHVWRAVDVRECLTWKHTPDGKVTIIQI